MRRVMALLGAAGVVLAVAIDFVLDELNELAARRLARLEVAADDEEPEWTGEPFL